jgi:hypothetical protein
MNFVNKNLALLSKRHLRKLISLEILFVLLQYDVKKDEIYLK